MPVWAGSGEGRLPVLQTAVFLVSSCGEEIWCVSIVKGTSSVGSGLHSYLQPHLILIPP